MRSGGVYSYLPIFIRVHHEEKHHEPKLLNSSPKRPVRTLRSLSMEDAILLEHLVLPL